MFSLFIAALFAFVLSCGGRAQVAVARVSDGFRGTADNDQRPVPLLGIAAFCAVASALIAALAAMFAQEIIAVRWHAGLIAAAAVFAAADLLWPVKLKVVREPTRSMIAIGAVLLCYSLTDAARLALFALTLSVADPWPVAIGGTLASVATASIGWLRGADGLLALPLKVSRQLAGVASLAMAAVIVLSAYFTGA